MSILKDKSPYQLTESEIESPKTGLQMNGMGIVHEQQQETDLYHLKHLKSRPKILGPVDFFDYNFISQHFWYKLLAPLGVRIVKLGWKTKYEGIENIPNDQDVIFMPNHVSHLDGPLAILGVSKRIQRSVDIIGDEKIWKNRYFRFILNRFNAFPVRKESKNMKIVDYALKRSKYNSILWFPEGQRHKNPSSNVCNPGKLGSGMLAHASNNPVVPVFITGAEFAMPVGKRLTIGRGPRSIKILVRFGKPVYLDDLRELPESKVTSRVVVDRIMDHIEALRPKGPYRDQSHR
jgi:1-acyl-sn-glycerol-3-phosphate acyltransferase